ncbi:hypothetical protein [Levilactobacillus sp. N40-8-2]|uniref:hypothetical protein n=1 Tax=Levilactobacillus muriae TaxID=3238987 RepID=UPI0038B24C3B
MQTYAKIRPWIAGVTACLTIGLPAATMIHGYVLMAQKDPSHPDFLVLMGLLIWGIVGFVGVLTYGIHGYRMGWRHLPTRQRILLTLYGLVFLIGLWIWLAFLGIIPYQWADWVIYGRAG